MALNQLGSVVYFLTLPNVDLSLAVPVANSLTFVFTGLCGWLLGEKPASKRKVLIQLLHSYLLSNKKFLYRYIFGDVPDFDGNMFVLL